MEDPTLGYLSVMRARRGWRVVSRREGFRKAETRELMTNGGGLCNNIRTWRSGGRAQR